MDSLKRAPIYPLLFGLYPVVSLLAHNVGQVKFVIGVRALVVVGVGTVAFFLGLNLLFRDRYKAAMICALFVIIFFSYGHIYGYMRETISFLQPLARHRYLVPFWLCTLGIGTWWFLRREDLQSVAPSLNLIAVLALCVPLVSMAAFQIRVRHVFAENEPIDSPIDIDKTFDEEQLPDIYYIILDEYGRDDVLRNVYAFDNTPFLDRLTEMGFYVARCSQSNYAHTELSMSSTFNMNYLEVLGERLVAGSTDRNELLPLLKNGVVRQVLEDLGYKVVSFASGFYWMRWEDADIYLAPLGFEAFGDFLKWEALNPFEVMLVKTTASRILIDSQVIQDLIDQLTPGESYYGKLHRDLILYILDQLQYKNMQVIQSPKFVYAHIISPHPPNVFGPNGEFSYHEDDFGYVDQVIYINRRVGELVEELISKSAVPPIVILQSDHGIDGSKEERVAILNAYYLPDGGDEMLYPWITPVNTFRVIFDAYFGTDLGLIEDRSYFSMADMPFDYDEIPITHNNCQNE